MSDTGDIYKNGKILSPAINRDGYRQIPVKRRNGSYTTLRIARAVAMVYIVNDQPCVKTEVNHKDYNRANDSVSNLEWVSHSDNVRYSRQNRRDVTGNKNPNYGNRKLSEMYKDNPELALKNQARRGTQNGRARPIKAFLNGELLGEFDYITKCCEFLNSFFGTSFKQESLRSQIDSSIRLNKPYKGIVFEKQ